MRQFLFILSTLLPFVCIAQDIDSTAVQQEEVKVKIFDETNEITIVTEEVVVEPNISDTTELSVGNKDISIIEEEGDTEVKIRRKNNDWDDEDFSFKSFSNSSKFKAHWAGFEFGLNNYIDKDLGLARTNENEFMEINTAKSWNFNFNFAQYSLGLGSDKFGMLTGLGLEWSNYHFSNSNSIEKNNSKIVELPLTGSLSKNRLQTGYLTIPLIFEMQFTDAKRNQRPHISLGLVGGIKLFSNTKVHITEDGNTRKVKKRNDYYLSPLRYGITARAGYRLIKVYFNYYLTPLFINNRGPELYPIAAGLSLSF